MNELAPLASHEHTPGEIDAALKFLKRIRDELRMLRRVRVWEDRFRIYDVNGDSFEIVGLGFPDADIVPVLDAVDTVYKRESIHEATGDEYKQFKTGRRYPWAADRVM